MSSLRKIYNSNKDIINDLNIYIGHYNAGNKNKEVKNTISILSHHLYKNKLINKKEYEKILKLVII